MATDKFSSLCRTEEQEALVVRAAAVHGGGMSHWEVQQ